MSADVVNLQEIRSEPVPGVVSAVQAVLDMAESGRIRAVGIVAMTSDGGTATSFDTSEGGIAELVLAIERIKLRLMSETVEAVAWGD